MLGYQLAVVLYVEELGQLVSSRRTAVDRIADAELLLISGYSGADPDVYGPLLGAAPTDRGRRTTWRCYSLAHHSAVHADTTARGYRADPRPTRQAGGHRAEGQPSCLA